MRYGSQRESYRSTVSSADIAKSPANKAATKATVYNRGAGILP